MATRTDGTKVPHPEALDIWAVLAYQKLKEVARVYNQIIRYEELGKFLFQESGLSTDMLLRNWIGKVLEKTAQIAMDAEEPPITSLCVRADGTIGDGYPSAPKSNNSSTASDVEIRAAEDRLLCYRAFAANLPEDTVPTLTPEVEIKRRKSGYPNWLEDLIAKGTLSVHDVVPFSTHVEVAKLFGRDYRGHQRATISLNEYVEVWFPKMYRNDDWDNALSADGRTITMTHNPGGQFENVMETAASHKLFITFGHVRPSSGQNHYQFLGVFELIPRLSDNTKWVYQRVSQTITFDGTGAYDFNSRRTNTEQDDLIAEASDVDPALMAAYQEDLDAGRYAVEDQTSETKSRGSAQAVFAREVKTNYDWECAVTGIKTRAFLVASHIVPWSEDREIRLDPTNGICLSTFVDRAFDAGYLMITPEGRTSVRWEKVADDSILKLELSKIDDVELTRPRSSQPDPEKLTRRLELGY